MHTTPSSSLNVITLPWQPDALMAHFATLNHQPWAMLLHSGFADHAHHRFDILVADPKITLQTVGSSTVIDTGDQIRTSTQDAL